MPATWMPVVTIVARGRTTAAKMTARSSTSQVCASAHSRSPAISFISTGPAIRPAAWSSSRNSMAGVSSRTAAWRSRTVLAGAGARSQSTSVSAPGRVAVVPSSV